MEINGNKLIQLITKFMRLTINKDIIWEIKDAPSYLLVGNESIPLYFVTTYMNKDFALFKKRVQQYSMEIDEMYWSEEIKFAIIKDDKIIWENKQFLSVVNDLFGYAQEQASGLNELFDELL